MDSLRVAEAYFALGRVHIHVDTGGVQREKQHVAWMTLVVQHVLISLAHRVCDHAIAHETAVHETVLRVTHGARRRWQSGESAQAQCAAAGVYCDRGVLEIFAKDGPDALRQGLRLEMPLRAAVVLKPEADVGTRERDALEDLVAMRVLGRFGFEELATRRRVEIEILHLDARSRIVGCRRRLAYGAALGHDRPAMLRLTSPASQRQVGNGGDAGKRLAPKAEARDALEIIARRDLAGCMTCERELELFPGYPDTVITDLDEPSAAACRADVHLASARVEAVFEQLLQCGRRPFDHFARRDLVDQQIGKHVNRDHGKL